MFGDSTEIVAAKKGGDSQGRPLGLYLVLAVAMLALVWSVMQPNSVSSLFSRQTSSADQKAGAAKADPGTAPVPSAGPTNQPPLDEVDPDKIVLPDINPSQSDQ
jgi:hypothetical protein